MADGGKRHPRGRVLLHQEVASKLRQDMRAGFHPRGTYLPSESDLCARFKVSRDTIRRALATLIDEGLVQSEPGVGHRVSGQVVSVRQQPEDLVAVIAPYGQDALPFAEMVAGLEGTLGNAGMRLVVSSMPVNGAEGQQAINGAHVLHVLHMQPHAVVCGLPRGADASELQTLARADIPVIVVGEDPPDAAVDFVGADHRLGAYMVSEWLANWAGDLPWCLSGAVGFPGLESRLEGYSLTLSARGGDLADRPVGRLSSAEPQALVAEIADWIHDRPPGRLGVFCANPEHVGPVATAFQQTGIKIGDGGAIGCLSPLWQVSAAGEAPACTAVWSPSEMGVAAAHLVIMRGVRGDARVPLRVLVAPRLVVAPEYARAGAAEGAERDRDERS